MTVYGRKENLMGLQKEVSQEVRPRTNVIISTEEQRATADTRDVAHSFSVLSPHQIEVYPGEEGSASKVLTGLAITREHLSRPEGRFSRTVYYWQDDLDES